MADVIFVAVIVAFFALAALLVRACDYLIGDEEVTSGTFEAEPAPQEAAA